MFPWGISGPETSIEGEREYNSLCTLDSFLNYKSYIAIMNPMRLSLALHHLIGQDHRIPKLKNNR